LGVFAVELVAWIFWDEHNEWAVLKVTFKFAFIEDIGEGAFREVNFEDLFGGIDIGSVIANAGITECLFEL